MNISQGRGSDQGEGWEGRGGEEGSGKEDMRLAEKGLGKKRKKRKLRGEIRKGGQGNGDKGGKGK